MALRKRRDRGTDGSAATMNAIEDARRAAAGLPPTAETDRMNGEVEKTSRLLQDAYACESTRAFPHRYLAVGYAARVSSSRRQMRSSKTSRPMRTRCWRRCSATRRTTSPRGTAR